MTARSVVVDLRARTAQYDRAIRGATANTVLLESSIGKLGSRALIGGVAATAGAIGALGIAAAAVGVAGAKMYAPYEKSLSRIVGLVGIAKDEVDGFDDAIRKLSSETAVGPQELADALYFITSAGLRGQDALDALTVSAEATTAGLGDTATVADLVTSAMNAYGKSLGGASVATDVLVASVREGKADAASFAGAMGRVIPIASQMGISFDQVGAAVAAMTRVGLDANESTTALRGIMSSLLSPSSDAEKALREVGLSAAGLRKTIREDGLLQGLTIMATAFEGNEEATSRVFGNVRALTGVLSLLGSNAEATAGIFDRVAASTGDLDRALEAATDTDSFRVEKAINDIKVALLDVGEDVLPKIADVMDDIGPLIPPLVDSLGDLAVVMADLGADAARGFVTFLEELPQLLRGARVAGGDFVKGASQIIDVLDVIAGPFVNYAEVWDVADERMNAFLETQIKVHNALADGVPAMKVGVTALLEMADAQTITEQNARALVDQLGLTAVEAGDLAAELIDNAAAYGLTGAEAYALGVALQFGTDAARRQQAGIDASMGVLSDFERNMGNTADAADDLGTTIETTTILPIHNLRGALKAAADEGKNLSDAMLELTNPTFKAQKSMERLTSAQEALSEVQKKSPGDAEAIAKAQLDVVEATLGAQAALDSISPAGLEATLQSITATTGGTRDEAYDLLQTLGLLDGYKVTSVVEIQTEVTGPLAGALSSRSDILDGLNFQPRALGGPVAKGQPYMVGERGPEMFVPGQSGSIVPTHSLSQTSTRAITIDLRGSHFTENVDLQAAVQAGLIAGGVHEEVSWAGLSTIR